MRGSGGAYVNSNARGLEDSPGGVLSGNHNGRGGVGGDVAGEDGGIDDVLSFN